MKDLNQPTKSLKNKSKTLASLAIAGLTVYGLEKLGITDFTIGYEINRLSYFGEWTKNFAEFTAPVARVFYDGLLGGLAGLLTYNILDK